MEREGAVSRRLGINYEEEEQCRRGQHASPGKEEHEGEGQCHTN